MGNPVDKLKCLHVFQSHGATLLEIKRKDLPEDSDKSDLYHWFLVREDVEKAMRLTFLEMHAENGVELRAFDEGELQFDDSMAELLLDGEYGLAMDRISVKKITRKVWEKVVSYLELKENK